MASSAGARVWHAVQGLPRMVGEGGTSPCARSSGSALHLFQMYLRELLRLMHPRFYQHLTSLGEDGLQMLFCHRWILLCFKREFPDAEALRMWEACWAHYQVRELAMGTVRAGQQCVLC